jgi:biopolymer transport protein TolQ
MDAAPSVLTSDNFSIIAVFLRADWVVKLVMLGLAMASLWSWGVIIDKIFRFGALNREADRFEVQVGSGRSLDDVAAEAGDRPSQAMPRMLQSAIRDWRGGRKGALDDSQAAFLLQRIDRGMDAIIARESARVEQGLSALAIVATSSPFIGLFGTVWGIMHAFQSIAQQKNTSLSVVAPSIAEALFATAVGLAAAIPAYIAYNKFSTDAGKFTDRLEGFADELSSAIARRLAGN